MLQVGGGRLDRRYFLRNLVIGASTLTFGGLLLSGCGGSTYVERAEFEANPSWQQDFKAQPDGPPDQSIWHYATDPAIPGYNHEQQGYTNNLSNVRVEHGTGLVLEARKELYRYPGDPAGKVYQYTSGRIDTSESFQFQDGKLEARMRLPGGAGSWPAFWLLSSNKPFSKGDNQESYKKDGEIDIMEEYGRDAHRIEGTMHTVAGSSQGAVLVSDCTATFHAYGIEITEDSVVWTADNQEYFGLKKLSNNPDAWPFGNGNQLYAIFNLAMGSPSAGTIDDSKGPWRLEIQDLKYYRPITNRHPD